jgi:hypothetical protein
MHVSTAVKSAVILPALILAIAGVATFGTMTRSEEASEPASIAAPPSVASDSLNGQLPILSPAKLPVVQPAPNMEAVAEELIEIRRRLKSDLILGSEFDGFGPPDSAKLNDAKRLREQLQRFANEPTDSFATPCETDLSPSRHENVAAGAVKTLLDTAAQISDAGYVDEAHELREFAQRLEAKSRQTDDSM